MTNEQACSHEKFWQLKVHFTGLATTWRLIMHCFGLPCDLLGLMFCVIYPLSVESSHLQQQWRIFMFRLCTQSTQR